MSAVSLGQSNWPGRIRYTQVKMPAAQEQGIDLHML